YLPSCTKNLVSGSQILSAGYKMRFSNSGIGIFEAKGRLTATARLRNGLFHFNVISPPAVLSSSRPTFSRPLSSQPEDLTLASDINQGLLTIVSNMDAN
ncbi:Bgt-20156, partial [Blumeria graminis f. sp. tritici]